MISIELIRTDPDRVRSAARKRGEETPVEGILERDSRRRELITEADALRSRRNEVSRQIGQSQERPPELIDEMRRVGDRIRELEGEVRGLQEDLEGLLLAIPNIPADDVPEGRDDGDNVVVRESGEKRVFDFEPLPHWELGERLDIIDFQRGVKLSGSRFYVLKGKGAMLQRALISWMLDVHVREHGYVELYLPDVVTESTAVGSGQLPKFKDNMYHDDEDNLWLVPTAEVPITGLFGGEILPPGQLPFDFVAHTPCFRREKAAAGKDTRGIKRVHQFEKVEMYKIVDPEQSSDALEALLADAEDMSVRLDIANRVSVLCTGDMGFAATKTYDLEMWAPGCQEWLEVSSCSNCLDFQSRRAGIRYRPEAGARPRFPHTLNGSGLGLPRTLISVLENYQQADGSIVVPEALRPYAGFDRIG